MEPNYKKMYALMCAAASDAIDNLPKTKDNQCGIAILSAALGTAETMYLEAFENEEAE